MNQQQDSWNQDIPVTAHQLNYMKPKELLKIVSILKRQDIATLKMKFEFEGQLQKNVFKRLLQEEQNDEYFRNEGKKKDNYYTDMIKRNKKQFNENGCIFEIKDRLRTEVFFHAYRGNKLDELQKNCKVKVYQLGPDIYVQGETKIKKQSIVYSELLQMYKKLKIYVFFSDPKLWNIVQNSQDFKKRLERVGIKCNSKISKNKHVAFYSCQLQPQQIRKQVLKQSSFEPRVLKLADDQLSYKDNARIFDILVKSIRQTIQKIRNTYQANLEINKKTSCFVLHIKHEVFAEEPVALISKIVSDLFIISFPLRNYRAFINQLKRNQKKYPFINATHYNKNIFCCIDRTKVKKKKDILAVFAPFLDQLNEKSKITIHMKPKCILQQNSTMPQLILDLVEECKLDVEGYQQIMDSEKFNIVIKPRLFNSSSKKSQKQLEFSNFLLKLLLISEKAQLTTDELNETILNHSLVNEELTDDSNLPRRNGRGNRKKQNERVLEDLNKSKMQEEDRKQQKRRGNRNERERQEQKRQKKQVQMGWQQQKKQQKQDPKQGCCIQYPYSQPEPQNQPPLYKKMQKADRSLQTQIQNKYQIEVKCWKLKLNKNILSTMQCSINKNININKQKGYLVKNIQSDGKLVNDLEFVQFSCLKSQDKVYLVYLDQRMQLWVPTHVVEMF